MKNTTIALLSLALIGIIAAAGATAFGMGFMQDAAAQTKIKDAIENNDFSSWKSAIESSLTEENFADAVKRRSEMESMRADREAMRSAMENKDYDAYVSAAEDMGIEPMTEENFTLHAEMHPARQDCLRGNEGGMMHGQMGQGKGQQGIYGGY